MPRHPIHIAAHRGDLAEVQRLITEDPRLMELRDIAADGGYDDDVDDDTFGNTPLLLAARRGHADMMEWFLDQGADRDAQDICAWDALLWACEKGHAALVSMLLDRGMDMNRATGNGWAPLMSAAVEGHAAIVEILLSRKEIEMDRQNRWGYTAIFEAIFDGHHQQLRRLLDAGADPRVPSNDGWTALDEARASGHAACIRLLEVRSLFRICPSFLLRTSRSRLI